MHLHTWLRMKRHCKPLHGCTVYTERAPRRQQFHASPATYPPNSAVSTPLQRILNSAVSTPLQRILNSAVSTPLQRILNSAVSTPLQRILNSAVSTPLQRILNSAVSTPLQRILNSAVSTPLQRILNSAVNTPLQRILKKALQKATRSHSLRNTGDKSAVSVRKSREERCTTQAINSQESGAARRPTS